MPLLARRIAPVAQGAEPQAVVRKADLADSAEAVVAKAVETTRCGGRSQPKQKAGGTR